MTVEKCVLLAKTQGMRYAGVEFGSECYFGNTLHTSDKASDGDCSQVCAGNQGEFCGNGNRVQVYQDSTWSDPTVQELTDVLLQYNSSLLELRQLSGQYQNLIQQWSDQQNSTSKRWWPVKRSLTVTQLQEQLTTIEQQYPVIQLLLGECFARFLVAFSPLTHHCLQSRQRPTEA